MPSDEYAPIIRGGLKLKGSKPAGVTKKKKRPKAPKDASASTSRDGEADKSALQKALEDEEKEIARGDDGEGVDLRELETRGDDGKTASERQYEEVRRKRVCSPPPFFPPPFLFEAILCFPSHFLSTAPFMGWFYACVLMWESG